MALRALSSAEREAGHRQHADRYAEPTIEQKNSENASAMNADATFPWRRLEFVVPPVPVPEGLEVSRLIQRWQALENATSAEARREALNIFSTGIKLIKRLMYPKNFPRWMWRFVRNPFREMSEAEFIGALGFLSWSRTKYPGSEN